MKIRRSYLVNVGSIGDAETKVYDLSYQKPITAIDIKVQATTGAAGGSALPVSKEMSNVSIVDGAFTLFSMILSTAMALLWALIGAKPQINMEQAVGVVNEDYVRIIFGRYYGDREFFLDTTRFNNPQLKLTSALTIAAASYATGTGTVTIIVHTIEEGSMAYRGCFMSKEIGSPTLASGAESYLDLPVDYPYAQITFFGTDGTVDPDLACSDVKLAVDNDSEILFNLKTVDILHQNFMEHGAFDVNNDAFLDLAVSLSIGLTDTTEFLRFLAPFGTFWLPLGLIKEGDFYIPSKGSTNRLTLTGGATGGATRAVLTQIFQ